VTNGLLVAAFARPGVPVITHVHELEYWIQRSGPRNWEEVKQQTTLFIAASNAVADNLRNRHQIPDSQIEVVHEFISTELPSGLSAAARETRMELGIPPDAFVVCGGGAEMWRKGRDLFVQLAARVVRTVRGRSCVFLWVGREADEEAQYWLNHDVRQAGLNGVVRWIGETADPLRYFAAGDAFAMVSREDPFPLVCLEAALVGKPVLCFANAGGVPEFVRDDAGFVVPYLDVEAMADRVIELMHNPSLCQVMGRTGAERVKREFSVEACAPKLMAVIVRTLAPESHL